jgi:hypothetical protein
VFDPDGHLPLLLQRTGLAAAKYPFQEQLLKDVIKDLLAFVLLNAPSETLTHASPNQSYSDWYPGFRTRSRWLTTFCLRGGTSFVDLWHLRASRFDRVLLIPSVREFPKALSEAEMMVPDTLIPFSGLDGPQSFRAWFRCSLGMHSDDLFGPATYLKRKGCRMLIRERTLKELRQPGLISKFYWPWIKEEFGANGWVLVYAGECPQSGLNFRKLAQSSDISAEGLAEWYLQREPEIQDAKLSPIATAWQEIIGQPVIPYDLEERRRTLAGAFDTLKGYISGLEKLRERKQKNPENEERS